MLKSFPQRDGAVAGGGDLGRLLDHKGGALTDGTRALLEGTPECPLVPSAT